MRHEKQGTREGGDRRTELRAKQGEERDAGRGVSEHQHPLKAAPALMEHVELESMCERRDRSDRRARLRGGIVEAPEDHASPAWLSDGWVAPDRQRFVRQSLVVARAEIDGARDQEQRDRKEEC